MLERDLASLGGAVEMGHDVKAELSWTQQLVGEDVGIDAVFDAHVGGRAAGIRPVEEAVERFWIVFGESDMVGARLEEIDVEAAAEVLGLFDQKRLVQVVLILEQTRADGDFDDGA